MVVIVFTAFMLIADTVALIHQHHESQQEDALQQKEQDGGPAPLLAGSSEGSNPPHGDLRGAGFRSGATE